MNFVHAVTLLAAITIQGDIGLALRAKILTKEIVKTPVKFTRAELAELWKYDMKPDSEVEEINKKGGKAPMGKSMHIVNGKVATKNQFPWQAVMEMDSDFLCGGSLVTPKHILTAAHCAEGVSVFVVAMGTQNREVYEAGRVTFTTKTSVIHEAWDTDIVKNDIAIVFIPDRITETKSIKTIRMPRKSSQRRNLLELPVTISGFGRYSDDSDNVSQVLNYVTLKVTHLVKCIKMYGKDSVTRKNLCVTTIGKGDKGTCNGDSGGPLVLLEKDGFYTQVGIVSYGAASGCAKGFPDVFTRVSAYLPWIRKQTGVNFRQ